MLTLLSPAKKLDETPYAGPLEATQPALLKETKALSKVTRTLSAQDFAALMDISANLAELNRERFADWSPTHTPANSKPAAFSFAGDVYVGLDAQSLDADTLAYAQEHLGLLSGLYGLLRPLDRMQPYRLEMGTSLANPRGKNLYAFWDEALTAHLAKRLKAHAFPAILNLASAEYFKAVNVKALKVPVYEAQFREVKDGQARMMMVFAKRARGLMARWVLSQRIEDPARLRDFDVDGYRFDPNASTETTFAFTRPWVGPAKG